MALIGVDIGNTNFKCVVIDYDGRLIAYRKVPSQIYSHTKDGFAYIDANMIFNEVARLCADAVKDASAERLDGLAVSGMGSAGVLLDGEGSQIPVATQNNATQNNAAQNNAAPNNAAQNNAAQNTYIDKINTPTPLCKYSNSEYRAICGYPRTYRAVGQNIAGFLNKRPELINTNCHYLSITDYINFRLTGVMRREQSVSGSIAPYDWKNKTDWKEFLDEYHISTEILPPTCESGCYIGCITAKNSAMGLPSGIPVYAGGHDYLCAAFAAGCAGEGDVADIIGTYELLTVFTDSSREYAPLPVTANGFDVFCDRHVVSGLRAITAETISAGIIEKKYGASGTNDLTRRFEELDGLSADTGSGLRGRPSDSLADIIAGLNFRSAQMYDYIKQASEGESAAFSAALRGAVGRGGVKAVGGGSRSRYWMQNKADATGCTLIAPRIPEAAAAGAALLAGVGCGIYSSYGDAARVYERAQTDVYIPNMIRNGRR